MSSISTSPQPGDAHRGLDGRSGREMQTCLLTSGTGSTSITWCSNANECRLLTAGEVGSTSPRLRGGGAPPSPTDEAPSPELEVAAEIQSLLHKARKRKLEILEQEALGAIASASVADEPTSWERERAPSPSAEAMQSTSRLSGKDLQDVTDEDAVEQQRSQRRRRRDGGSDDGLGEQCARITNGR